VSSFRDAGLLLAKGVVPVAAIDEVGKFLNAASETSIAWASELLARRADEPLIEAIARKERSGTLGELPKEALDILAGQLSLKDRLSPVLLQIPKAASLQKLLREMLGSTELFMHMPPMARFVPPGHISAAVPPHQDIAYNKHMTDFITCWIPLTEIDDRCGGVGIFEGTNVPIELERGAGNDFWLGEVGMGGRIPQNISMEPGDALLFTKWTVHTSMPNLSNRTRFSIDLRFFGAHDQSSKHYLDLQRLIVVPPRAKDDRVSF